MRMPAADKAQRRFTEALYGQLARVGRAFGNRHRLEILDLLAQGERSVEEIASEVEIPVANASQHLRVLLGAELVARRRAGAFARYRLADDGVFELSSLFRSTAERRVPEVERLVARHAATRSDAPTVGLRELALDLQRGDVAVLDVRPRCEFAAGHVSGAISAPVDALPSLIGSLPSRRFYVAYCRGPYCVFADRAVSMLARRGLDARRLRGGFPEWKAAGLPIAVEGPAA